MTLITVWELTSRKEIVMSTELELLMSYGSEPRGKLKIGSTRLISSKHFVAGPVVRPSRKSSEFRIKRNVFDQVFKLSSELEPESA